MPANSKNRAPRPHATAADLLRQRLQGLPPAARRLLEEAGRAVNARRADVADASLARARANAGDHPEVLRMLGVTRHLQGRRDEALDLLRRALELMPGDPLVLMNLGVTLRVQGELAASEDTLQSACSAAPWLASAWYNLGTTLAADVRPADAERAYAQAIACDPNHVDAHLGRADALRSLGDIDGAASECRHAIGLSPRALRAWSKLANLKTIEFSAAEIAQMQRLLGESTLRPEDRASLGFALAKAFDDAGRDAEAEAMLMQANACKRRLESWDADAFHRKVEATARAFATLPPSASPPDLGHEVIFVVSMPRSGSTLVEQILASHPEVEGAGEISDLARVLDEESTRRDAEFPDWAPQASPEDWRRMGEAYLARTARWRAKRPRFTDKSLDTWLHAGAAMAMLPGAHFVNVRRDPLETCLSVFRQLFGRGHGYSYDPKELARFWRDYDRLARQWQTMQPDRLHDFTYERLLADPEAEIRALLACCNLPHADACLRFHETERDVRTPSSGQVRQPLRRDTARASRYPVLAATFRRLLPGAEPAGAEGS